MVGSAPAGPVTCGYADNGKFAVSSVRRGLSANNFTVAQNRRIAGKSESSPVRRKHADLHGGNGRSVTAAAHGKPALRRRAQ